MAYSRGVASAPTRLLLIAAVMLARGTTNAAFAIWLAIGSPSWDDIFRTGATYAVVDGVLGFVAAVIIEATAQSGTVRILGAITLTDAIARIGGGMALQALPGIAGFPVALLAFFGAAGAAVATLGIGALGVWLYARVRSGHAWPTHADALLDPLALTALLSFVVGYVLILNPPGTSTALRNLVLAASTAMCLAFVMAFIGSVTHLSATWSRTFRTRA